MLLRMGRALIVMLFSVIGLVAGLAFGAFRLGFSSGAAAVETYADAAGHWHADRAQARRFRHAA